MKYIHRTLSQAILRATKTFPAIVLTGPRQSGKTTLLKNLFSKTHKFISLENPNIRLRVKDDPIGFLQSNKSPVIFDEIQYVPELISYIKTKIDEDRKPGQWLFTGSQNFVLLNNISQSLAGRAAILSLLPFSYSERIRNGKNTVDITKRLEKIPDYQVNTRSNLADILLRGDYPEIASNDVVDRQIWCSSYISTYLERDIRNLSQVGDLGQFEQFLRLIAIRTGQIINLSEISRDIGISVQTAKRWLSLLETGYLIHRLYPYHKNIGKRLIKSPEIYFTDTALASYLLGIHNEETLIGSPHFGHLFETMIVTDFLKRFYNCGELPSMYYIRTRDGLEIDLVIEINQKLYLFEIKSGMTITNKHLKPLTLISNDIPNIDKRILLSNTQDQFIQNGCHSINWHNYLEQ